MKRVSTATYQANAQARKMQDYNEGAVCWICGGGFDWAKELGHERVVNWHKNNAAWSADHVIPYSVDPSLNNVYSNLRGAHLGCNKARGNRVETEQNVPLARKNSREW